ncbi:uncharacterized protein LOC119729891 isoform X2 [Patiria miniata]|uniref:Uncharacterized protein n=1 Tax=Patiria miniata TaxID=46514 RepID=A0A914A437_PATMI|nr:uncharacterized protein LOC119729891 isoform X2 [Patiria miniata]
MAQYEYCVQGLSKVCQGIPCDVKDIPKLPNIAEIFKTCPVPGLQESCLLLILLLLIPISAASMFAIRKFQRVRAQPKTNLINNSQPSTSSLAGVQNNVLPPSMGHELQNRSESSKPVAV